jgi:hypothetical protein
MSPSGRRGKQVSIVNLIDPYLCGRRRLSPKFSQKHLLNA